MLQGYFISPTILNRALKMSTSFLHDLGLRLPYTFTKAKLFKTHRQNSVAVKTSSSKEPLRYSG